MSQDLTSQTNYLGLLPHQSCPPALLCENHYSSPEQTFTIASLHDKLCHDMCGLFIWCMLFVMVTALLESPVIWWSNAYCTISNSSPVINVHVYCGLPKACFLMSLFTMINSVLCSTAGTLQAVWHVKEYDHTAWANTYTVSLIRLVSNTVHKNVFTPSTDWPGNRSHLRLHSLLQLTNFDRRFVLCACVCSSEDWERSLAVYEEGEATYLCIPSMN